MNTLAKDDLKVFYSVQGIQDLPDVDFGKFRINLAEILGSLAFYSMLTVIISKVCKKAKDIWINRKQKGGFVKIQNPNQPPPQMINKINNASKNQEVFGRTIQVIFWISFLLTALPFAHLTIYTDEKFVTIQEAAFLEMCVNFLLYLLLPLFFYIRNPKLRSHTLLTVKDLIQ